MKTTRLVMISAVLMLVAMSLTGCGTYVTRHNSPCVGKYPYQGACTSGGAMMSAVLPDPDKNSIGGCVSFDFSFEARAFIFVVGAVSLPFDVVVDTLLLPVDIGAWILGEEKNASL
jgi:uncharacterized protein YceK